MYALLSNRNVVYIDTKMAFKRSAIIKVNLKGLSLLL